MREYKVYKIINSVDSKIYVGQTINSLPKRLNAHIKCARLGINRYLYDAINKYGTINFRIELIEICESKEKVNIRESLWIKELNSLYPLGYNLAEGGDGGNTWKLNTHKELTSKRLSHSIKNSEKHRNSLNTIEFKKGQSERSKANWSRKEYRDLILPKLGHDWTEEQRLAMSRVHKDKPLSVEHRKRISESNVIKWSIPENRLKLSKTMTGRPSTRKGRTYEEIYGIEKAKLMKLEQRDRQIGRIRKNRNKYEKIEKDNTK